MKKVHGFKINLKSYNAVRSLMGASQPHQVKRLNSSEIAKLANTVTCLSKGYLDNCFNTTPSLQISGDVFLRSAIDTKGREWLLCYVDRAGDAKSDVDKTIKRGDEVIKCDVIALSADYTLNIAGALQGLHTDSDSQYTLPNNYDLMRSGLKPGTCYNDCDLSADISSFLANNDKAFFQMVEGIDELNNKISDSCLSGDSIHEKMYKDKLGKLLTWHN